MRVGRSLRMRSISMALLLCKQHVLSEERAPILSIYGSLGQCRPSYGLAASDEEKERS